MSPIASTEQGATNRPTSLRGAVAGTGSSPHEALFGLLGGKTLFLRTLRTADNDYFKKA